MKKWMSLILVCIMVLSLCACGQKIDDATQLKLDLYDKYEKYIDMLEDEDYEKLIMKLMEKYQEQQQQQQPDQPEDTDPTDPPEPNEEERLQLEKYYRVVSRLYRLDSGEYTADNIWIDEYDDAGNYVCQHNGQSALQYCFRMLQELTVADNWTDWLQKNYGNDYDYNWNRLELLGKFSMVEGVQLQQTTSYTDNMGNQSAGWSYPVWTYDQEGRLARLTNSTSVWEMIESNPMNIYDTAYYTYDENGWLTEIRYGSETNTYYRVAVTNDDAGIKVSEHVVSNDGETDIFYTYDDQGRLSQISWKPITSSGTTDTSYVISYTYDEAGHVVKEEKVRYRYTTSYDFNRDVVNEKWIREYTYDANGHLATGTYTYEDWDYTGEGTYHEDTWSWTYELVQYIYADKQDQYTYTCDDQGRVLTQNIEYGNQYYRYGDNAGNLYSKADYATGVVEYIYGNYMFYTVAE